MHIRASIILWLLGALIGPRPASTENLVLSAYFHFWHQSNLGLGPPLKGYVYTHSMLILTTKTAAKNIWKCKVERCYTHIVHSKERIYSDHGKSGPRRLAMTSQCKKNLNSFIFNKIHIPACL